MTAELESTATLLAKVKGGDDNARARLCSLYLPILTRWAHGRLPDYVRDLSETSDMVQTCLLKALSHLDKFTPMHEGAFLAYLRKILLNNIRMEIRRYSHQSNMLEQQNNQESVAQASTIELAVGNEIMDKYEQALTEMSKQARETVILRVEFGYSYPEIATAMNYASSNAARMMVSRALLKLADNMR